MLRHSVFAIVLVGAAFAGGAVMNGTGLAWFKALASGGPRIVVEDGPAPKKAAPIPFPTAKTPPLDLGNHPAARLVEAAQAEADPAPPVELPPAAVVAAAEPPDLSLSPSLDPGPTPNLAPLPSPDAKTDPVARLASTRPEDAPAGSSLAPASGPARDWGELRRKIRASGVARYEIAAEVDGRVKFSCVIPVDGLRAVGHHFEAEGDDEFEAAEAALRRVALWRATESR